MKKPLLLYYEVQDFQKGTLDYINRHFDIVKLPDPNHDTEDILREATIIFAPMGFVFGREKIDKCRNLRVIGSPTTGLLHIDVDYVKQKEINICSLKDQRAFLFTITPTAELAWGLIVAVTRHIIPAYNSVCEGKWDGYNFGRQTPKMLSVMTLGVVGLGRLGSLVARYGQAFKMKVFYYDPYVTDERYIRCNSLIELAQSSNIVSIHLNLTEKTENLINKDFIHAMPRGSFIINTARGEVLDEGALLEGLTSGYLAGAGLDILKGEHLPDFKENLSKHPLVQYAKTHDNLIITPKMGGCTVDAWEKTEKHVVDLIIQELKNTGVM
ncbi:MAG: NAD(P)-dependent oxidoreductase [Thermodesulfobacteriota bacterium]